MVISKISAITAPHGTNDWSKRHIYVIHLESEKDLELYAHMAWGGFDEIQEIEVETISQTNNTCPSDNLLKDIIDRKSIIAVK